MLGSQFSISGTSQQANVFIIVHKAFFREIHSSAKNSTPNSIGSSEVETHVTLGKKLTCVPLVPWNPWIFEKYDMEPLDFEGKRLQ